MNHKYQYSLIHDLTEPTWYKYCTENVASWENCSDNGVHQRHWSVHGQTPGSPGVFRPGDGLTLPGEGNRRPAGHQKHVSLMTLCLQVRVFSPKNICMYVRLPHTCSMLFTNSIDIV